MSVFNGGDYLALAVRSILDQTFGDFEFIVVDDGSTDQTRAVLEGLTDPRLRVTHRPNMGRPSALNHAIASTRAEYVARMDADDIAFPARLERQVRFLDTHPEVALVGCRVWIIDERDRFIAEWRVPTTDREIREKMMRRNPFCHPAVMFRRSVYAATGGYDTRYQAADDYDLWFKMAREGQLANLPDVLFGWRLHPDSVTRQKQRTSVAEAIKVRARAVLRGTYPARSAVHLLAPALLWLLPSRLNRWAREMRYRRGEIN